MESGTYKHLIKPLSIGAISGKDPANLPAGGPGNADRLIRMCSREHLEGMNLSLAWGVHTSIGDWHGSLDPHVHSSPECLLFVGLDTANVKYLGAEISICLGPEKETYTFNEPTVVVIPPGLPHGPITTDRMYSPRGFGCWSVVLASDAEITWLGEGVSGLPAEKLESVPEGMKFAAEEDILRNKPIEATGKYAHLVKPLKSYLLIERGKFKSSRLTPEQPARPEDFRQAREKPGPGNADHMVWMCGRDLEDVNANIFWGFCNQPGSWNRGAGAHVHPVDEVLVYLGMDPENTESLGAEIEIDMGKEHERHIIDKPTALICPAGTPHMPQVTRWVDKPFAFFTVCLSGEKEAKAFD